MRESVKSHIRAVIPEFKSRKFPVMHDTCSLEDKLKGQDERAHLQKPERKLLVYVSGSQTI